MITGLKLKNKINVEIILIEILCYENIAVFTFRSLKHSHEYI